MAEIATHLVSWLQARVAVGVLTGPGLIWLALRLIRTVELRMILRSLPREDRITAAVAYLTTAPGQRRPSKTQRLGVTGTPSSTPHETTMSDC
jgi:hypothetical protein